MLLTQNNHVAVFVLLVYWSIFWRHIAIPDDRDRPIDVVVVEVTGDTRKHQEKYYNFFYSKLYKVGYDRIERKGKMMDCFSSGHFYSTCQDFGRFYQELEYDPASMPPHAVYGLLITMDYSDFLCMQFYGTSTSIWSFLYGCSLHVCV